MTSLRYVLFILIWVAVPPLFNAEAAENICFNNCHDKQAFKKEFIHEPIKSGLCTDCHNPHVARYPALLSQKEKEFCYKCHKDTASKRDENIVHQPFLEGQCLFCHDPHSSALKGLIKSESIVQICVKCHKTLPLQYKNIHKPFAEGSCNKCHQPHQSNYAQLLADEPDKLCLSCHVLTSIKIKHSNYPAEIKGCLSCHHPHGSDRKALIRSVLHEPYSTGCQDCHNQGKTGIQMCLRCHVAIEKKVNSIHNHLSSKQGNSCVICHSPHAADGKYLLLSNQQETICKKCHFLTFAAAKEHLYKHPDSSICSNCHDVHGSNEPAMLKGDGIAVCVSCHKTQGQFSHPVGEQARDKRNDQKMTCVTCHYPHGTDYKYALKLSGVKELCVQCHRSY